MALAAVTPASASAPGTYLSWQNKAPQAPVQPAPTVAADGQTYAVPPSPYGQVGDPFARSLNWSGKAATAKPAAQPKPQSLANIDVPPPPAAELPKGPVSLSSPVPVAKPAPVRVPDQAVAVPSRPQPQTQAMPQPAPAPQPAPPVAAKPAPAPAAPQQASTDGYQVPATSKYAARIAAARAQAQAEAAPAAPPQQQAAAAPAKGKTTTKQPAQNTATAPAPAPSLASQETDHVFIPGEQYTNAQDGPRFYSLHRAYGLAPDPITVDRDATGAILETADLNADEKAPDDAKADKSKDSTSKTSAKP